MLLLVKVRKSEGPRDMEIETATATKTEHVDILMETTISSTLLYKECDVIYLTTPGALEVLTWDEAAAGGSTHQSRRYGLCIGNLGLMRTLHRCFVKRLSGVDGLGPIEMWCVI